MRPPPAWVRDAVFYQIVPDRFRPGAGDWSGHPCPPDERKRCGGDLAGIAASIPYLESLGITAVYLTPIFHAGSYHGYDTIDYYAVDPNLGDRRAFRALVKALHDAGIRVILDGVFNHCSVEHPFFVDAVRRGPSSPYWPWFQIRGDRVMTGSEANYARWAGVATMPEWNHDHEPVTAYLLDVVRHWLGECGIDGWRLDTVEYLPPDFVRAIRDVAREVAPEAYILGEVMGTATSWFRHDAVDGVMHYRLWEALARFVGEPRWDAQGVGIELGRIWHSYPEAGSHASYTLLSSHDRPRFLTLAGGDRRRLRLAIAFQMMLPGAPAVYYGDEIGMEGGDDPDNRRPFPWNRGLWDSSLLEEVRSLIGLRRSHDVLRRGGLSILEARGRCLSFARTLDQSRAVIIVNAGEVEADAPLLPAGSWTDALTGARTPGPRMPPMSYRILLSG
jgi:glycosidase